MGYEDRPSLPSVVMNYNLAHWERNEHWKYHSGLEWKYSSVSWNIHQGKNHIKALTVKCLMWARNQVLAKNLALNWRTEWFGAKSWTLTPHDLSNSSLSWKPFPYLYLHFMPWQFHKVSASRKLGTFLTLCTSDLWCQDQSHTTAFKPGVQIVLQLFTSCLSCVVENVSLFVAVWDFPTKMS